MDESAPVRVAPRPTMMLVGRIALGAIFLMSGVAKLADQQGTLQHMEQAGIPAAHLLLLVAAFAEIFGALALMTGFLARLGAIGLVVYLAITTLVFHHFWDLGGDEQKMQMINFMKNLAIIGGLLVLSAAGAQRYSIDARRRRPVEP
jgi:putative oxidoreductase